LNTLFHALDTRDHVRNVLHDRIGNIAVYSMISTNSDDVSVSVTDVVWMTMDVAGMMILMRC
jgi:hypothetical protein